MLSMITTSSFSRLGIHCFPIYLRNRCAVVPPWYVVYTRLPLSRMDDKTVVPAGVLIGVGIHGTFPMYCMCIVSCEVCINTAFIEIYLMFCICTRYSFYPLTAFSLHIGDILFFCVQRFFLISIIKLYSVHFLSFQFIPVQFVLLVSHKCSHTDKFQIKAEKSCFKKTSSNSKDQLSKRKPLVNGIDS